ncbi:DUF1127 domain-containing protein [Elioraea sp.]|uniref:DUF1127 domain-containing protein n=1 Tax=Elioraea sp. TaxID=2185103 RepID=UPI0021DD6FC9|nr:DUF1127 domain-containing protein [Elioraea sp.]GIX09841.1 MAG: hypothetical protein KatS3mg116_1551 [Elioraea sp.]
MSARTVSRPALARPALPSLPSLWDGLRRAWVAHRTRRQLLDVDEHLLHDLGLSRADVWREARRAPWDLAPIHRGRGIG